MELIARGGFMMYPLLLSAFVAFTVIIERTYFWGRRLGASVDGEREALAAAGGAPPKALIAKLEGLGNPLDDVLAAGLARLGSPALEIERAMQHRAEQWTPIIERRLDVLDTVITAAPLMGLLGTITGMMASFHSLSDSSAVEGGAAQAITAGVAEALIATATGLVIALVCLLAYNYFQFKARSTIYKIEGAAGRLLAAVASGPAR